MIAATRRWFRRNQSTIAIGVGVLGTGYVATQYVLSKLKEARESMSSDRIGKENLRRRFQQNQEDCTFTVLALLPTATENILEALPVENITHELQRKKAERLARSGGLSEPTSSELSSSPPSVNDDDGRSMRSMQSEGFVHASQVVDSGSASGEGSPRPKNTKIQLWNELKISSITRAYTLIYTLSLLTLLTRIQLNLLGRRSYLSSVISLAHAPSSNSSPISLENNEDGAAQAYGNDFETNRRYLTFSWWLLHRGWQLIQANVEAAVKEVFNPLSLREDITVEHLASLILEVRKRVEGITDEDRKAKKWLPYLLPPREQEDLVLAESGMQPPPQSPPSASISSPLQSTHTTLRRLLDETADLIDSPPFCYVNTLLLDAGFTQLSKALTEEAFQTEPADSEQRVQDVTNNLDAKIKLAAVLAVVTKQAHQIGSGMPNLYLQVMENVGELEAFAAVVYSNQWEAEGSQEKEKGKESEPKSDDSTSQETGGEASLVTAESGFESAWGKAVEKVVATAPAA